MNVRSALARMTGTAVDLTDQTTTIRQLNRYHRTDCWPARFLIVWMTCKHHGLLTGLRTDGKSQMQAHERVGIGGCVAEKERRLPLVGRREVESAVAIDIRQRDASG